MGELTSALLAFPTVIYSGALVLIVAYWLLVIAGAVDLDGGGDHGGLLDAALAKGEVAGGVLDAAAAKGEAAASALDGHAAAGHATAGHAADTPGIDEAGSAAAFFNLRRVPLTVTLSFFALFGWIATFCGMRLLGPLALTVMPSGLFGALLFLGSLVAAVPMTSLATRPLEGLFKTSEGRKRHELVGAVCEIRSGRVDEGFGQATLQDDGAELVIDVRIDTTRLRVAVADGSAAGAATSGRLKRGDSAIVIDYDEARGAYLVEPYDELLGHEGTGRDDSTRSNS